MQSSSVNTTLLHKSSYKSSYNVALYLDPRTGSLKVPLHLGQNDLQYLTILQGDEIENPMKVIPKCWNPWVLGLLMFCFMAEVLQRRECVPPPSNIQASNLGVTARGKPPMGVYSMGGSHHYLYIYIYICYIRVIYGLYMDDIWIIYGLNYMGLGVLKKIHQHHPGNLPQRKLDEDGSSSFGDLPTRGDVP